MEYTADLLSAVPTTDKSSLLPSWTKGGANATLFLHHMPKPQHGTLQVDNEDVWTFYPGKSKEGIMLVDLVANCQDVLDTGQLFCGHAKFHNVYITRNQLSLKDFVLCHVSAHGLKSLIAPTSLKAQTYMTPGDQLIWNDACNEEYDG